jgi:LuxR family transcriptional regulator, maltose regulon positive regulatory protein
MRVWFAGSGDAFGSGGRGQTCIHLLAGLAHRELGDQRAANQAAERALALAESDRLVLPFAMTGSGELLEALPRHQTAHAALLADILDVLHGSSRAAKQQPWLPPAEELSPGELRVLRYLPTNLSRPEIAAQLSVSPNTVSLDSGKRAEPMPACSSRC